MTKYSSHYGTLLITATGLFCAAGLAPARAAHQDGKPSSGRVRVLAIAPLDDPSGNRLGFLVKDYVVQGLNGKGNVRLVDQQLIDRVIEELIRQHKGLSDQSTAKQLGKLANADLVVFGAINSCVATPPQVQNTRKGKKLSFFPSFWSTSVSASFHCLDVETGVELPGQVVHEGKGSGPDAESARNRAIKDVAGEFVKSFSLPPRDGVISVIDIDTDMKRFAIDAGSDDGVGKGDHFRVRRLMGDVMGPDGTVRGHKFQDICEGKVVEAQAGVAFLEAGQYKRVPFRGVMWDRDSKKLALIQKGDIVETTQRETSR